MGAISFGGLATGLDTTALVKELMAMERRPVTRLEAEKSYHTNRLEALKSFDTTLLGLLGKLGDLDSAADVQVKKVTQGSTDFFSATPLSTASTGSYQLEVVTLAQVQKTVSAGYAERDAHQFGTGVLRIQVGADPGNPEQTIEITLDENNNSLAGIREAINAAGAGISATLVNDGTANPYRLVVAGGKASESFVFDTSGLTGAEADLEFLPPPAGQTAQRAHIRVDNIDIYADSNTLNSAIHGISLDLLKAQPGTTTSLTVGVDETAVKGRIEAFVSAYNEVIGFINGQAKNETQAAGVLSTDSGLHLVKRRLQDLLVTPLGGGGQPQMLSQLGLETQKDGTLKLNDQTLSTLVKENLDGMTRLLAGGDGVEGAGVRMRNYLREVTDVRTGLVAGRKEGIDRTVRNIDNGINRLEARLASRERGLRAQFNALEKLVSVMNSQSSYIGTQMKALENMWSKN